MPLVDEDRLFIQESLLSYLETLIEIVVHNNLPEVWSDDFIPRTTAKIGLGLSDFNHQLESGEVYHFVVERAKTLYEIEQKKRAQSQASEEGQEKG